MPDRATIANMAPEYGATMGFFPVDNETLAYLNFTARSHEQIALVEAYAKAQGLFRSDATGDPEFVDSLALDLGSVEPSLAGPRRPQDRVSLGNVKKTFEHALQEWVAARDRAFPLLLGEGVEDTQDALGLVKEDVPLAVAVGAVSVEHRAAAGRAVRHRTVVVANGVAVRVTGVHARVALVPARRRETGRGRWSGC